MSYKYIDGYENYIIYEDGKIYNQNTKKFLKGYSRVDGYINTCLHKDGKPKFMSLHRLIALSFIPNPHNKPFIDHINRIRDDNRIENLRWATSKQNNQNRINNTDELYICKRINKTCKQGFDWRFQLTIDGKTKCIKSSIDKQKVIKCRDDYLNSVIVLNSLSI